MMVHFFLSLYYLHLFGTCFTQLSRKNAFVVLWSELPAPPQLAWFYRGINTEYIYVYVCL